MVEIAAPTALAPSRRYALALGALLVIVAATASWNAFSVPTAVGYDVAQHQDYVRSLLEDHRPPGIENRGAFWKPPAYFAVAAVAIEIGERAGMNDAVRAGQYMNVVFVIGAAAFVLAIGRLLWTARPYLHLAAIGFFALVPGVLKMAATFHPASLAVLMSAAALYGACRLIVRPSSRPASAVALGVLLVVGVLVMPHLLAAYAAVLGAFAATALARPERRREMLRAGGLVLAVTVVAASPWFIRQAVLYSNPFVGPPLPGPSELFTQRSPDFYFGVGLPEIAERPFRESYNDQLLPVAYSELWGDYFGVFSWHDGSPMTDDVQRDLRWQMAVGALPTILGLSGWLGLIGLLLRRGQERASPAVAGITLLPLIAFVFLFAYATAFPAPDGDTMKGTYMLVAAPAWALAFGFAVSTLGRGLAAKAVIAVLVVAALVDLRFLVNGSHFGGLL